MNKQHALEERKGEREKRDPNNIVEAALYVFVSYLHVLSTLTVKFDVAAGREFNLRITRFITNNQENEHADEDKKRGTITELRMNDF